MTPGQAEALGEVLEAIEDWVLVLRLPSDREDRAAARLLLIDAIDELLSAIETNKHGGLGRGGQA